MGIYKRGKTWWGRLQRNGVDQRRSLKTPDKGTAERRYRAWREELDATAWGEKPRHSYVEAEGRFIQDHLPIIKPSSAIRYGYSLKLWIEHLGGNMLHQIGSEQMMAFETRRRNDGVKPPTILREFQCLSAVMAHAVDLGWIDINPVPAFVKRRQNRGSLKKGEPRDRYLSAEEEAKLLAASAPDLARDIVLAIDTGLRRGEQFSLTWPQVNFQRCIITTTTDTKSHRSRPVPLPIRSAQLLAQLSRRQPDGYVLVNPDTGTRFFDREKGLENARRKAGIAHITWHDLRRTAGCRWLQRDGKSMAEVSALLGHTSVTTTERHYAFLEREEVAASLSGRTIAGTATAAVIPISKVRQ
jgi:integrase/recombinase XerD